MPAIFAYNAKVHLSAAAALVWFLYHVDRIRLWPLNDEKKRKECFLPLFYSSVYPVKPHGKSNTCTTAEPTCCPVGLLCRSDCSTECRTRWCSLQKQTSRGAAESTGTCSVPTTPSASLHCCLFYSSHSPQHSSHHSHSELKVWNWNTNLV